MKRIGIIAGAGPDAGIDLWKKILEERRSQLGGAMADVDAPAVVVFSVPELGWAMDIENREADLWRVLSQAYLSLARHADLICIACNVLHRFVDRLRALDTSAELVSVVDAVEDHLRAHDIRTAGLLSISSVVALDAGSPYARLAQVSELVTPQDPAGFDVLVKDIKRLGADRPELRDAFDREVRALGVGLVLLACTELPLVSRPLPGIEQIDATRLLAKALLRKALDAQPV